MTKEQLLAIIEVLLANAMNLQRATAKLVSLLTGLKTLLNGPYGDTVDVTQLITIYTPIYTANLAEIETAADTLNTDN